jgi:hypothetical protein
VGVCAGHTDSGIKELGVQIDPLAVLPPWKMPGRPRGQGGVTHSPSPQGTSTQGRRATSSWLGGGNDGARSYPSQSSDGQEGQLQRAGGSPRLEAREGESKRC